MRSAVVDRVETEQAVVIFEGEREPIHIPLAALTEGVREGDYLLIEMQDGEVVRTEIDADGKAEAERRIQAKLERLRKGDHLKKM